MKFSADFNNGYVPGHAYELYERLGTFGLLNIWDFPFIHKRKDY